MPTPNPEIPVPETSPADLATPPAAPATPSADDFDFDGEFDPERAKRLIAGLKADKLAAREAALEAARERDEFKTKWQAHEADQLTAEQRQAQELETARKELAAERRNSALVRHHLPESALLFLTADSAEDIEAQAAALASLHGPVVTPPDPTDPHVAPQPNLPTSEQQIPPSTPPFDPVALARAARQRH